VKSVRGDEHDIVEIYQRTIRPLYGYVSRRVGGNAALAEDLVQETWMHALDTWPSRGMPDEPLAWLIRVAHNTLVSHFRRVRPEAVDVARIDLEAPAAAPDSAGTAALVSWALSRMRRGQAELLEAFYFDGKSVREIAHERSMSERGVEGRLRRARIKLKKVLDRAMRPLGETAGTLAGRKAGT
jgi:RNA polymerase sigma-70 factor (ECF subfamily)